MARTLIIISILFSFLCSNAQAVKDSTIQVGYTGSEPFSIAGETPKGIAIDLWREIALKPI
ncbi:hypothetical protein JM658_01560 [Joostella atrarenae]|uniref:Uncharacterized protein n=1 Tax=Joostella atrarenae TaxID=679257 RepID=A0ABS9IZ99_9FLAO|nr:hypothetical protein [Joostella atrarenae]MCF8713500.1 hypothetical protein [Joostella atrarenae]